MMRRPSLTSSSGVPIGSATLLLSYLGIDTPQEIDIEAIAQACGATIVYDALEGCEARLVGFKSRALITVNERAPRARQRFSAAHELGHWIYDRGRVAFVCADGQLNGEWGQANPERRANRFAADLLLPRILFKRQSRHRPMTLATVRELSRDFETSLTATAIRLVDLGSFPAMLICHDKTGKKRWATHNHLVPALLKPRERIVLAGTQAERIWRDGRGLHAPLLPPTEVLASRFIDHPSAGHYRVLEDSQQVGSDLMLTMLWWQDEAEIRAGEAEAAAEH